MGLKRTYRFYKINAILFGQYAITMDFYNKLTQLILKIAPKHKLKVQSLRSCQVTMPIINHTVVSMIIIIL